MSRSSLLSSGAAVIALACLLGVAGGPANAAEPPPSRLHERHLAALDRALRAAGPDALVIALGDMQLPRAAVLAARARLARSDAGAATDSAFPAGVTLWPGGVVPYAFAPDVTPAHQRAFLDAARDWATFAAVTFVPRTAEPDYVFVQNMPSGGGFSAVGKVGGAQSFLIGPFAWNRGTLAHELGHTLGLIHEHQRSDRDSYVALYPANLPGGVLDGNYVLLPTSENLGAYDFLSIMHYSRLQFSTNGQDTMQPLPAYASFLDLMGNNPDRTLSLLDRQKLAAKYGPGPALTSVVTNTQDSGPGSLRAAIYYGIDHPGTTITFAIPGTDPGLAGGVFRIQPSDVLTRLGAGTVIDGLTQPGAGPGNLLVALDGTFAQAQNFFIPGLRIREAGCFVRGLLVSGFPSAGLELTGPGATGNVIVACRVGTDAAGLTAVANGTGIGLTAGATNNVIGGTTSAARNVISGNTAQGIALSGVGTSANQILGNYLGLNAAGSGALPNAVGIGVFGGATGNFLGGTAPGSGNVVSGNTAQGITLSESGTNANLVRGNYVGTNPAGSAPVANGNGGIAIYDAAQNNIIGGTESGAGNLVSGNVTDGIFVGYAGTNGNQVLGNLVGTDATGTSAIPNSGAGIDLYAGAQNNVVGGTTAAAANLVSGNTGDGIFVAFTGTNGNTVSGNRIGLNRSGSAALGNQGSGISVYAGAQANTIGGIVPGAGNLVAGNTRDGIFLGFAGTNANVVSGNRIGLDATGLTPIANGGSGVVLYAGAQNNVIGGGFGAARNFIAGNAGSGVVLAFDGTTGNQVLGNVIGLNLAAQPAGNAFQGVVLFGGAQNNLIGGAGDAAGNVIGGNGAEGIAVFDATTTGNTFRRNQIAGDAGAGIALFGGSQGGLAPPTTLSAVLGLGTTMQAMLSGAPAGARVEFFATPAAEAGSGAGRTFLGEVTPATATFTALLSAAVPAGQQITATVTDPSGNTSAFSNAVVVTTVDTLGGGIPDVWRAAKFGPGWATDPRAAATADPDGDGWNNLAEFRAGLNPNDSASRFAVGVSRSGADTRLTLPSVAGIPYQVQVSSSLIDSWLPLGSSLVGTGAVLQALDPGAAASATKRFYRVVVLP